MKFFVSRAGLLFAAVFAMSFALHCISAMDETLEGFRPEMDQNSIGGVKDAERNPQSLRDRRSVKGNSTQDILKRLRDMEKK